jgi:hypothetical protein
VIRFAVIGMGEVSETATLPQMTVQVVVGPEAATHTSLWEAQRTGWKGFLP